MQRLLLAVILVASSACKHQSEPVDIAPRDTLPLEVNRGTVVGRVLDDRTSKPLPHLIVLLDDYPLAETDSAGWYEVSLDRFMEPGWHEVNVASAGYIEERRKAWMNRGTLDTVDLRLRRAPPPVARLRGSWSVLLRFEQKGAIGPSPSRRVAEGSMTFADSFPSVWPNSAATQDTFVTDEIGRFDIDLSPFFGSQIARDVSSSTFGSTGGSFAVEATGSVFAHDSVSIDLIPRISHGGLSLSGRLFADSIIGRWVQRAYCCGATGSFRMRRVP